MEQLNDFDVVSDLIAAIYDCAIDPNVWSQSLE